MDFKLLTCYDKSMPEYLHELLEGDDPVALRRIERALHDDQARNETVETVVSALIWRRCTTGHVGVLGAVLDRDCAARVGSLVGHLDRIGASDAAKATRNLLEEIPLPDEQIRHGLIDWVDAHPDIARHAAKADDEVDDIAPKIWNFMQQRQDDLPNPKIADKQKGLFGRLFAG